MSAVVSAVTPAQAAGTTPSVEHVFGYATEQIMVATEQLWPGDAARLLEHVPSVTSYVCRIQVGHRSLYAKYSYLGSSLVSVLRGRCGDWNQVRAAQLSYVRTPGSLLAREAVQLRFLDRLWRPRACRVVGYRLGALFTEPARGVTLAQMLREDPSRTPELLECTWQELGGLHSAKVPHRFARSVAIEERGIAATFARKFPDQLAVKRHGAGERGEWATLCRVVERLNRLRATAVEATAWPVLVYGDLKPEHVAFERDTDRPVFLDPALLPAHVTVDAAKLISRTVLFLIGSQPDSLARQAVCDGVAAFVDRRARQVPATARMQWLRELVTLWLMDTVNILTTYRCAPAELPMPAHAKAVLSRAPAVLTLVDEVSAKLAAGADPHVACILALYPIACPAPRAPRP